MKTLFVFLLSWTLTGAQDDYQGLVDYLENRLLAIQGRMQLWRHQSHRYRAEMLDFKTMNSEAVHGLRADHSRLSEDLRGASVRAEQAERELDYMEARNSPRACADWAERVVEQEARGLQERDKDEDQEEVRFGVSDCVEILSSIKSAKILKRMGSAKGMWTRDPKSTEVYVFNGTSGDSIYRFDSVRDFSRSAGAASSRTIQLPFEWSGPGSAVYNGFLYFIRREADMQVVKYDLLSGSVTETALFPMKSHASPYKLNPETIVDLSADDEALWLLFSPSEDEPNISLAKMNAVTLDIEQMWDTRCPRQNAEAAFVVCGTVYMVYNTPVASRSRVQCVFDVNDAMASEEAALLYFPRRYGAHASLKYNPEEGQLYGWDDGYQIIYKLTMKTKVLA